MGFEFDTTAFRNSPAAVRRFPFPFDRDQGMCAVNIERHTLPDPNDTISEHAFDMDEHCVSEMRDRALVLAEDPLRCQSLPHMTLAGWDLLELVMDSKARDYPQWFDLHRNRVRWRWLNRPLGIDDSFTFLDESTLPYGPMEHVRRQAQGDFADAPEGGAPDLLAPAALERVGLRDPHLSLRLRRPCHGAQVGSQAPPRASRHPRAARRLQGVSAQSSSDGGMALAA